MKDIEVNVDKCSRCYGTHGLVIFKKFTIRCGKFTHWGVCPKTGEPILFIEEKK